MPTINIPDKMCPCCGGTKWRIERCSGIYKDRFRYRCSNNAIKRSKKYYYSNIEKSRESSKIRNSKRERTSEIREYEKLKRKEYTVSLTNTYIKRVLYNSIKRYCKNVNFDDIKKELIDIKRDELLLNKKIKHYVKSN